MATEKEIRELRRLCEEYKLEGREILEKFTDGELAATYNGIGPEAFPDWLRKCIDALHPSLEPVAFIHDIEWSQEDKSPFLFAESNERFKRNGCKVAKAKFGWWRPRRYIVMNQARRFGNVCGIFGFSAWKSGKMKTPSRTGAEKEEP
ncbi:MAG: hypothetical protein K6F50_07485 [Kiritimatiellae bacterium]|nr:hypothetical protein [Kiritimatiellia bacterium]